MVGDHPKGQTHREVGTQNQGSEWIAWLPKVRELKTNYKFKKIFLIITSFLMLLLFAGPVTAQTTLPEPLRGNTLIGYFVPGSPATNNLIDLETKTDRKADIVLYYQDWTYGLINQNVRNVLNHGSIPLLTWIPCKGGAGTNQPDYRLKNITNGKFDQYLRESARAARNTGETIWLRPFHEMNGNWSSYSGTTNGNSPEDFIPAWRHIVDIFRQEGADNVLFVWSPNTNSVPDTPENAISVYFPGDDYVDIIGIDGYNWGTSQSWSHWNSFYDTFAKSYKTCTSLSTKPIIIAETGSSEKGGDKAAWIKDTFNTIYNDFPRIKGLVWFNINKETDWRIESSIASLESFKSIVAENANSKNIIQFVMKFNRNTSQDRIDQILYDYNLTVISGPSKNNYYYLETQPGINFNKLVSALSGLPEITRIDRNYSYRVNTSTGLGAGESINNILAANDNYKGGAKAESSFSQAANRTYNTSPILEDSASPLLAKENLLQSSFKIDLPNSLFSNSFAVNIYKKTDKESSYLPNLNQFSALIMLIIISGTSVLLYKQKIVA